MIKPSDDLARLIMSEAYVATYGEDTGSCVEYEEADVVAHIEADRAAVRERALLDAIEAIRAIEGTHFSAYTVPFVRQYAAIAAIDNLRGSKANV